MTFIRSIITVLAVCLCIAVAYAIGHGLSAHNNMAFVVALVLLLVGGGMVAGLARS